MLNEISTPKQMNVNANLSAAPAAGSESSGKLIGKAVRQVVTPQSVLANALEELSIGISSRASNADLKSRKEKDRLDRSMKNRLEAYKKISQANDPNQVDKFVNKLKDAKDVESVLRDALDSEQEPADAWVLLNAAYENLKEKGADKQILDKINTALKTLDERYGAAIRAGINGSLMAAENYVSLGEPKDLGNTYRKAVLEFTDVTSLYSYVQEKHGGNFEQAINFLYSALNSDLNCDTPSSDRFKLESLNTSLGKLRSFQSAHAMCDKVLKHNAKDNEPLANNAGIILLGKILDLGNQPFPTGIQADNIARTSGCSNVEERIIFLQDLITEVRSFSPLVFDSPDGRSNSLGAIQSAIDTAVNEEDEMLAAQG
ncbi:MAG: type III secretion system gatekeeper subunit SctW [Desulfovibrionaceae bacterium]|nr:type III secretion system gatekeeper subunit SctW [Desulfovibrionaceae bacterium]